MRLRSFGIVLLVSGFATSAFAADRAIQNGIDVWSTAGDGSTFVDFAYTPIPAGFFFEATVRLDGVQPITQMVIHRENEKGGTFSGPLWLNVKVSFTPVGRAAGREALEIPLAVRFRDNLQYPWRAKSIAPELSGFVRV